jgi:hypothetical protein
MPELPTIWTELRRFLVRPVVVNSYSNALRSNWTTALGAYEEAARGTEDTIRTAQHIADALPTLTDRIRRIRPTTNEGTLQTYLRRMRSLLEAYTSLNMQRLQTTAATRSGRIVAAMIGEPKIIGTSAPDDKAQMNRVVQDAVRVLWEEEARRRAEFRTVKLGPGRDFTYRVTGDLRMKDVMRIVLALVTDATDFDPETTADIVVMLKNATDRLLDEIPKPSDGPQRPPEDGQEED